MNVVERLAPTIQEVISYDRHNLALYAALLDADEAGACWRETASSLMDLDPFSSTAEACWRSHLERARWIVGDGLASAVVAFGHRIEPSIVD